MPTPKTIEIVTKFRVNHASDALTGRQAKLYSQRLRREMGQPGLATFLPAEVAQHLDEALSLIEFALIERHSERNGEWKKGIKRAAEILEFLSQTDIRPRDSPIHFLSAAAYQVAGYPAMALAQLMRVPEDEALSLILREFLRGNFSETLKLVRNFWAALYSLQNEQKDLVLSDRSVEHTIMCIGTICMYFKTGDRGLVARAVAKLHSLASGFLLSRDPYSYLLSRLTAFSAEGFVEASLWEGIAQLSSATTEETNAAFNQFGRSAFVHRRSLIWPTQMAGISRLRESDSFVLCTPTGSGKTTVATIAIVQALFTPRAAEPEEGETEPVGNLILYIVPSRALAAEVEKRLAEDLRGITASPIVVTGLYGGIDWGPTDAWIQTETPTIVICTFEKADALLRYLGVLFLHRVRLVIIDEAHMVEQDTRRLSDLRDGSSRALRLELVGTRLLDAQEYIKFRIIALSAVAAGAAPALARWISGSTKAIPTTSDHRSTRQMLGRLEVSARGEFSIFYDLMNGQSLRFEDNKTTPYIPTPFPPLPNRPDFKHPETAMRAVALWAGLHLAAERPDGTRPSVLISLTQNIGPFANECADLIEKWSANPLPPYWDQQQKVEAPLQRSLASVEDYFGRDSAEYRLLEHGIAVHHGKMPSLLARRLKVLIDFSHVRIIIATSTLSEGVNIPVSYLLIPSISRSAELMDLKEFTNLTGRAGRPGVSTEGHALVLLPEATAMPVGRRGRPIQSQQRSSYFNLIGSLGRLSNASASSAPPEQGSSALLGLLSALETGWHQIFADGTSSQFLEWLEQTAVTTERDEVPIAIEYLDSLDAFLIATIQELEQIQRREASSSELEEQLARIWQRSYAFAVAGEEKRLRQIWLSRGGAIKILYPEPAVRRKIYRSSLPPRSAMILIDVANAARDLFVTGEGYSAYSTDQRLAWVGNILALLSRVPAFRISTKIGRKKKPFVDWRKVLSWWLAKDTDGRRLSSIDVANWYDFSSKNFIYLGSWGVGSILSLLLDNSEDGKPIAALKIDDWPRSGLPWIAFWFKELLIWGTLEPVAAYLLARGNALDRTQAQIESMDYYTQLPEGIDENEKLNPRRIRDWLDMRDPRRSRTVGSLGLQFSVVLARSPGEYYCRQLPVLHFERAGLLSWVDPAGYLLATSFIPPGWPAEPDGYHFILNVDGAYISGDPFRRHV